MITDKERLEFLLGNRQPGPVCWFRLKNGESFLINSKEKVDFFISRMRRGITDEPPPKTKQP
jgi:hypothetical protein